MAQDLFPTPSPAPSKLSPRFWPGISPRSTESLRNLLRDNHDRWHVYFDPKGFHNHSAHFLLAQWTLGADASILEAAYKLECEYQRPSFDSPEPITVNNFKDHLGDDNYYKSYRAFFTEVVNTKGPVAAIEEYIFDLKMNFDPSRGSDKQPEMLNRFFDGLVHPMIHVGYGLEFGLPGMVVEGLSSAAIHHADTSSVITRSLFEAKGVPIIETLTSHLPSALKLSSEDVSSSNVHAFTILARMLKDPQLNVTEAPELALQIYTDTMRTHGERVNKYVREWTVNTADPKEVECKIEELVWTMVMIYGIPGWTEGGDFNADFFHMHLVTSSLFLSSLAAQLNPTSQELLLRGYFAAALGWWVGRGRPSFDIAKFFAADTGHPTPLGPLPTPSKTALPSPTSPVATTPNPWLPIIQTSIVHRDDHLPKLQRSLAHYATLYGLRSSGQADFSNTELPDADKLDGTLFLRVAGLTSKRVGRVREGEEPFSRSWDRPGFYKK
ncbi:hypothetical protein BDZ94DRAFT_1305265 [Collybia nuda]|uniref:Oxidoreductase AflY n=1 Tax=Collybia nuda TaxID=64659 RepID=A0A9P5YGX3_9AGAR|nr:hypothetical protein BDZ94DRAFT_1305265 [Collybia nuda]